MGTVEQTSLSQLLLTTICLVCHHPYDKTSHMTLKQSLILLQVQS